MRRIKIRGTLMRFAYRGVGEGREQAVPAHPALTAFVHPCTADAEASLPLNTSYGNNMALYKASCKTLSFRLKTCRNDGVLQVLL